MSREQQPDEVDRVEPDIPAALRERIDELFVDYRGYEPTTLQESLSVVCDLAESQLTEQSSSDSPSTPAITAQHGSARDGASTATSESTDDERPALGTAPQSVVDVVEAVFPDGWDETAVAKRTLPAVVDEYASALESDVRAPEQHALEEVAARREESPATLRESLVDSLYGSEDIPEELRTEFFSEALDVASDRLEEEDSDPDSSATEKADLLGLEVELTEHEGLSADTTFDDTPMEAAEIVSPPTDVSFDELVEELDDGEVSMPTPSGDTHIESLVETASADGRVREVADEVLDDITGDMFDQMENGVDHGVAGVADGMGTTTADSSDAAPEGPAEADSAPVPTPPPTPSHANDSVPGPLVADPETDCDDCGETYRVSMLETTIRDGDQSVVLLCADCRS
jgi:hypothetical protein